jgi:hypothetical protein
LIFSFTKLGIIAILLLIIIIVGDLHLGFSDDFPIYAQTVAQDISRPKDHSFALEIDHFLNGLKRATRDECVRIFGKYSTIIAQEVDFNRLYFVSYEEVDDLLDQAVNESIDSLTLFTFPRSQNQDSFAIGFNQDLLEQVQRNYNFHALFNISAQSIEDGSLVKMRFLVIGQGKLIVGYNSNAKIKHQDYDFATGKYDYRELFTMDAGQDADGNACLFNIKGLSNPNGHPQWMQGPLNVDIQSLTIGSDQKGREKILIQYDLWGAKYKLIDPIPIEKLNLK